MEKTKLSFFASCTASDILFTAKLDDEVIYRGSLETVPREISYMIDDIDGDHCLSMSMSGKMSDHTKIDADGNIVSDHVIKITNVAFDDIPLRHVFTELAVYEHDFNGTADHTNDRFFGDMGCNGTVTLKFTTPIYLWLLENM